jgi:FkbM family methyltransferase
MMLQGTLPEILSQLAPVISDQPRRVAGEMLLQGRPFRYADLHSFYHQAVQIFAKRLYDFESSTDTPLILDCGAHIGLASLYFATRYPGARIVSFEADPCIADMLVFNIQSFGIDAAVRAEGKAVWIDDGGAPFSFTSDDAGYVSAAAGALVPTVRLRDLIDGQDVELLKLDVEGSEFALLHDCDGALGGVSKMIVEVHRFRDEDGKLGSLLSILERNGFRYVLSDLHHAGWMETGVKPPFAECPTDKYIVSVFAWR